MKAIIKDGLLTIEGIPVHDKPVPSASGKTLVLASTGGFMRVQAGDQTVSIGLNVTVPNPAYEAPAK